MKENSEASPAMMRYFEKIDTEIARAYELANRARAKGHDPERIVSIPLAKDMAERVEGLVSVVHPPILGSGISKRIQELEEIHGKLSWKVALHISLEVAKEKFCAFVSKEKALEIGIRVGLAYLTLGVVASPLEGFVELKIKKRMDTGENYFCLMFSGPIRSAGGTAASVCVVVADYLRKSFGYAEYDATEKEVKRAVTELYDYHDRITNLQYLPSEEEIEFLVSHLPVQIDGDASEKIEVSNYKDLPRIEANKLRNGFCLVVGECLCQKAAKLEKQLSEWGKDFDLDHWKFLKEFVALQKRKKAKEADKGQGIQPDFTFIKDLVAGRPILGFPLRHGGFRLRYGRARNSGYSSAAIHPATTYILDKFVAVGTQLKLERPGKAASMSTCDSIEGSTVLLEDGSVERVQDIARAKLIAPKVKEILYLGDILINYGDFFNRAHPLVPAGYCEEWWILEVEKALREHVSSHSKDSEDSEFSKISKERFSQLISERFDSTITGEEALALCDHLNIPLHPQYTFYWNALPIEKLKEVVDSIKSASQRAQAPMEKLILPYDEHLKRNLELLAVPHSLVAKEHIVIPKDESLVLTRICTASLQGEEALAFINSSGVLNRDKAGTFIGSRMGRPEKGKVRKLDGQPHCLFPVGEQGGRLRSFQESIKKGEVSSDFPIFRCVCGNETVFGACERCGELTTKLSYCKVCGVQAALECPKHGPNQAFARRAIDIEGIFDNVVKKLGIDAVPDLIKGVRGTSNKEHLPEHLAKGILRAKHDVPVNKDGTTRYDMTQLAITHFTPAEINVSIEKIQELGYSQDVNGNPIRDEHQVIEMFPQDLILPMCEGAPEEGAEKVLLRVAEFIDELLGRLYHVEPYYRITGKEGLIGQLVVGLAPHTSAGIVGRILGFSRTQGFYAHPMFHAATRRDCDGDEACVTLLMDALLNFSRTYLPGTRGATQDAPLVMTSRLTPAEVDDMVFDVDIASSYPLELYEAAQKYKKPWEVKVEQLGKRLKTPGQYEGMKYTHSVSSINKGVLCSSYKLLPTMEDKLRGQMALAAKIRAVDEAEVAKIVIEKHFIRDIRGNLRKYTQQEFRCVACNEKFRRPPLVGKCTKCQGKLLFTISEGSIVKYLEPALSLARHYNVPAYLLQSLELTQSRIESMFGREKEKQEGLGKWFG